MSAMDQEQHRKNLQAQLKRDGGVLPDAPDGPVLAGFEALSLAQGIESELNRAKGVGHSKIRINMDLDDAAQLASFLRRATLLGA